MDTQATEKKSGCSKRVVLFFGFAIAIVAAFLIVMLVKTCDADHEEKEMIEQQELGHVAPIEISDFQS